MNARHAQYIRQVRLGQGAFEGVVLGEGDGFQTKVEFTNQLTQPRHSVPAPQRHQPLSVDGRINQRFKPKRSRKTRGVFGYTLQVGVLENRDGDVRQGNKAVIHRLEKKTMQIDEVPR